MSGISDFRLLPEWLNENQINYELKGRELLCTRTMCNKISALRNALEQGIDHQKAAERSEPEFNECVDELQRLQDELKTYLKRDDAQSLVKTKCHLRHYYDRAKRAAGEQVDHLSILQGIEKNVERLLRLSTSSTGETINNTIMSRPSSGMGRGRGRGTPQKGLVKSLENLRIENRQGTSAQATERDRVVNEQATSGDSLDPHSNFEDTFVGESDKNASGVTTQQPYFEYERRTNHTNTSISKVIMQMWNWEMRFSGDDSMSLTDFLLREDLHARAMGLSRSELFRGLFVLLKGSALEWYEVYGEEFFDWTHLVNELKARFLPQNYDFIMREEILMRLQQPGETVANFLTQMEKMFRKIYPPLEEEYKLYVLQRNMAQQYALQLALIKVNTVAELMANCKKIDDSKFVQARKSQIELKGKALEAACFPTKKSTTSKQCSAVEEPNEALPEVSTIRETRRPTFRRSNDENQRKYGRKSFECWNCRKPSHSHFDCPKPRTRVYCWCCGREGFTALNCPRDHKGAKQMFPDNIGSTTGNGRSEV